MLSRGKVVLFYPPYDGPPLGAPLSLLALAGTLREANFEVVLIDAAIEDHHLDRIEEECASALCIGISVLTGPMIRGAIIAAQHVKRTNPSVSVVFGGWHPTLCPESTLREPYVDIVVRGQGELTIVELAVALAEKKPLDFITGISWKKNGRLIENFERRVQPVDTFAQPAFDMTDFDAYEKKSGKRELAYATSIGCPYACNYCTDMVVYKRRFNAYAAEHVVAELTGLVKRYRITHVALLDSNFPVDLKRAIAIARGIVDSGVKFAWTFQASTDFICRMSQEEVQLLADSGVRYMGFGTESTSKAVLKMMNKRHQRVDEMYETARKAELAGIRVNFNLILGYPGETEADRLETFRTMSDIGRHFKNVRFSPNIFTPYPGIPIWPQLRELGVVEPQTLEEWETMPLGANLLPWLRGRELARLNRMLAYFLLLSQVSRRRSSSSTLRRILGMLITAPIRWRLTSSRFSFPWEIWLSQLSEQIVKRRSLITGQALPAVESANA
ncbi:B12-binding domain-containing radical SAM protein [Granulicella tundricola]|uniref:Radical SAM domain protein n=1 Tax=Granulicella tundricola (strain ATCC BAA-1859 / DSM 23138 / MP5ACTX9) TaxID=1198114 RepID=E8WYQ0_GRATM|nr:radical SAM protein [Granulicella tundricola]ADW67648.1 Radical SAM domain protein [Granulicella tundricola MP5ACTX9]